jgi:hypothetical protein
MNPRAPEMKTFEATWVLNPGRRSAHGPRGARYRMTMQHKHDTARPHMTGRRFRQQAGCHAGEIVCVVGQAPHFDGYWLVEAECGKRWAMREGVLRSRLRHSN